METGKEASVDALREMMSELLEQARKSPEAPSNEHHQIVKVFHADPPKPEPWHARVSATSCIVMFVMLVVLVAMYIDLRREQQRTQDHQSVIYQLIPDLRKMVNEELCRQGKLKNCKVTEVP